MDTENIGGLIGPPLGLVRSISPEPVGSDECHRIVAISFKLQLKKEKERKRGSLTA